MKISGIVYLDTADALKYVRALKALKALKRPKLGYKLGDHFVRKRKEIEA